MEAKLLQSLLELYNLPVPEGLCTYFADFLKMRASDWLHARFRPTGHQRYKLNKHGAYTWWPVQKNIPYTNILSCTPDQSYLIMGHYLLYSVVNESSHGYLRTIFAQHSGYMLPDNSWFSTLNDTRFMELFKMADWRKNKKNYQPIYIKQKAQLFSNDLMLVLSAQVYMAKRSDPHTPVQTYNVSFVPYTIMPAPFRDSFCLFGSQTMAVWKPNKADPIIQTNWLGGHSLDLIKYSHDGTLIAITKHGFIEIWNVKTGVLTKKIDYSFEIEQLTSLCFISNTVIAYAVGRRIQFYDIIPSASTTCGYVHCSFVERICYIPRVRRLYFIDSKWWLWALSR